MKDNFQFFYRLLLWRDRHIKEKHFILIVSFLVGICTAAALSALWTTPSLTFFAGGVERIIAVVLHLSLSILVFQSIRKKSQKDLLNAYLFHFVIDSLSVLLSAVASVWVVELVVALVTGGAVLMAKYACMEE